MRKKGFTLIELLVVIAVIALLMAVILPSLGKAKEYAQRVICRNNIRQQCLGVTLYADDNETRVPTIDIGFWLWDIAFWTTNQVSEYAGITENDVFFCPANRIKKADDARMWQYSWYSWAPDTGLHDESTLTVAEQKAHYRVMPDLWFFYKNETATPPTLITGEDAKWIDKISTLRSTGSAIMIMDNMISSNNTNFFKVQGGLWTSYGIYDNSNHASRHKFSDNNTVPLGSNIGYADGHVDWRSFENMEHKITSGQWFWW